MAMLPIDMTSAAWRMVETYARQRREELVAECIALGTQPAAREHLAARIAEIDELLAAPDATKRMAEGAAAGQHTRRMY